MTVARRVTWTVVCGLTAGFCHAAEDVDGATDPLDYERFPGSWIVAYSPPKAVRSYEFVTGRVDRSGRTLRMDDSRRLAAEVLGVTYRAPDGTRFDDVIDHYREQIVGQGADIVFTCRARDCGRSTSWANSVFGVKELVAPDASQFYLAATLGRRLVSAYIVQRGSRRVYAHLDVAEANDPLVDGNEATLVRRLREHGFAIMGGVTPGPNGGMDVADLQAVDASAQDLAVLKGRSLYVVCHLGGAGGAEASMARSSECAETVVARLRISGIDAFGFGGGPLLPRVDAPAERVELVLPPSVP